MTKTDLSLLLSSLSLVTTILVAVFGALAALIVVAFAGGTSFGAAITYRLMR